MNFTSVKECKHAHMQDPFSADAHLPSGPGGLVLTSSGRVLGWVRTAELSAPLWAQPRAAKAMFPGGQSP